MSQDFTTTQMIWRAPLLRLTQVGMPGLAAGKETVCYVDPQIITNVRRVNCKIDDTVEYIVCTEVKTPYGYLHVTELPELVASMRDEAFGFPQKLTAVK